MTVLVALLLLILIFAVAWWLLNMIPGPPPLLLGLRIAFGVIVLLALIDLLTGSVGLGLRPLLR